MSFLGRWEIDDLLTFPAITHRADTGALTDADAVPAYRVYEDETSTAILTGNMAKLDDANTTGFYSEQITLSAANGFENGKSYTIYITAAVNSVTGGEHHTFQVEAAPLTASALFTTQMTEAYAADGVAPTLAQALFQIMQFQHEKNISGTTLTVKKIDGSTTAMTFTLDSATAPAAITRST